jgi:hypothetical protein
LSVLKNDQAPLVEIPTITGQKQSLTEQPPSRAPAEQARMASKKSLATNGLLQSRFCHCLPT